MSNSLKVAVKGHFDGVDEIVNVWSFYSAAASAPPAVADVATWLDNIYTSGLLGLMSTGVLFERFVLEQRTISMWAYCGEAEYLKQGSVSGDALPHMNAYMITGITNGRARAKKFFPGVMENFQSNGILTSGCISALQTVAAHWLDDLTSGGNTWNAYTLSPTAATISEITAVRVDSRVHALNRRFPGRGS